MPFSPLILLLASVSTISHCSGDRVTSLILSSCIKFCLGTLMDVWLMAFLLFLLWEVEKWPSFGWSSRGITTSVGKICTGTNLFADFSESYNKQCFFVACLYNFFIGSHYLFWMKMIMDICKSRMRFLDKSMHIFIRWNFLYINDLHKNVTSRLTDIYDIQIHLELLYQNPRNAFKNIHKVISSRTRYIPIFV